MKKVSIRQAIIDAVDNTDPSMMRYELQALKWARYIEKEIGSINGYILKANSFIVDGDNMDVPADCVRIRKIIYGDYENELNSIYKNILSPDLMKDERTIDDVVSVKLWMPAEIGFVPDVMWEQRIDKIQFMNEMRGTTITLFYNAMELDEQGYWLVSENHIKAITDYLIYMLSKKYFWRGIKGEKMIRQGDFNNIELLRRTYERSIRNARATDDNESEFERKQY